MARLQENARFALEQMAQDIRMALHVGCRNVSADLFVSAALTTPPAPPVLDGQLWDPSFFIDGLEQGNAAWQASGHTGIADATVATFSNVSDAVTVRYLRTSRVDQVDNLGAAVAGGDGTPDLQINASASGAAPDLIVQDLSGLPLNVGQLAAVADCGSGDVFLVNGINQGTNTVTADSLQRAYDPINRALLAEFVAARYFVRPNADGVPALFRTTLNPSDGLEEVTQELVDGVESLQLLYGQGQLDANGALVSITGYVTADAVTDWGAIGSVRIGLLMRTVDEFGDPDDSVYDVVGALICAPGVADPTCDLTIANPAAPGNPDRRRRRVFQTEVVVRNVR
jgi:type IV pilus assembly protein PilW